MTENGMDNSAAQDRDRHLRTIAGRDIYFDREDFLWDPRDWDDTIDLALAREMGLAILDETQWQVIRSCGNCPVSGCASHGRGRHGPRLQGRGS